MSEQPPFSSTLARTDAPLLDPFGDPGRFEGVLWRRTFAYIVDLMVLAVLVLGCKFVLTLLTIVSFGLLAPLFVLAALIPLAYHTLTIGSPGSATLGMRLFGLEVRVWNGGKPGYTQALLHTAVFYVTTGFTGGLILLWPLFSNRRRCLHDLLCGTLVIRRAA